MHHAVLLDWDRIDECEIEVTFPSNTDIPHKKETLIWNVDISSQSFWLQRENKLYNCWLINRPNNERGTKNNNRELNRIELLIGIEYFFVISHNFSSNKKSTYVFWPQSTFDGWFWFFGRFCCKNTYQDLLNFICGKSEWITKRMKLKLKMHFHSFRTIFIRNLEGDKYNNFYYLHQQLKYFLL